MPIEPSELQSEASRVNGAKSQGPVTDEGKAASSRNAAKHELLSASLRMSEEEILEAADLRAALERRHAPRDVMERRLIEAVITAMIKMSRLDALEFQVMERLLSGASEKPDEPKLPSLGTLTRYRARIDRDLRLAQERLDRLRRAPATLVTNQPEPLQSQTLPASEASENLPQEFEEAVPPRDSSSIARSNINEPNMSRQQRRYRERQAKKEARKQAGRAA